MKSYGDDTVSSVMTNTLRTDLSSSRACVLFAVTVLMCWSWALIRLFLLEHMKNPSNESNHVSSVLFSSKHVMVKYECHRGHVYIHCHKPEHRCCTPRVRPAPGEQRIKHADPWASVPRPWFWGRRPVFRPSCPSVGAQRGSMGTVVSH